MDGFVFLQDSVCSDGQAPLLGIRWRWELLPWGTPKAVSLDLLAGEGAGSELFGDAALCSPV